MSIMIDEKWIDRFLSLATDISGWSKDPSTKVGAVLINKNKKIIGAGYNGLSSQYDDKTEKEILNDRDKKISRIIHAEENCLINTDRNISPDDVMFITHQPCVKCVNMLSQKGVRNVIYLYNEDIAKRFNYQDTIDELNRLKFSYAMKKSFNYTQTPQQLIHKWCEDRFGELFFNSGERMNRLLEEVVELAQAEGFSKEYVEKFTNHVFSREADEPKNEIGGVVVTLMSYLSSKGYNINNVAMNEYQKIKKYSREDIIKRHQRKVDNGIGLPISKNNNKN
mgnify:CR=1 FL=1